MRIEQVDSDDLVEICCLARVVWLEHFPGIISNEQIEYMLAKGYTLDVMMRELKSGVVRYIKLLVDGELIGFASYGPMDNGEEVQLHKLYIHPRFQRVGYGEALLQYLQSEAAQSGCKSLVLAVNKGNKKAISAYLKNGFTIKGSKIVDIGSGFYMDDYIMIKNLVY